MLFLYAHNILYVEAASALRALPLTLAPAAVVFFGLRLATGSAIRAGLATSLYTVLFFSYGAVLDLGAATGAYGQSVLLPVWLVLAATGTLAVWRGRGGQGLNGGLNLAALVLVLMPATTIVRSAWQDRVVSRSAGEEPVGASRAGSGKALRDIYFIVLDEYQRRDALLERHGFDNGPFESALEERGFYIASEANSNYTETLMSLAATLNMRYMNYVLDLPGRKRWRERVERHAVGRILRDSGYTHIHVSSGKHPTATSDRADVVYDFSPSGLLRFGDDEPERRTVRHDSREFTMLLLRMTPPGRLIGRAVQEQAVADSDVPYVWYAPERTLETFELVATIPSIPEPTFTFVHVIKPHAPYMFDRHGNVLEKPPGWTWEEGRDDSRAMLDQLVFLNELVLDLVDELQARSELEPIIIIQGDHGDNLYEPDLAKRTRILSAFFLPDGGGAVLYPSVSSVNTFRLVLSYYLGLELEPLPFQAWVEDGDDLVEVTHAPGRRAAR